MVTFALACSNSNIDMIKAGSIELERIWRDQDKIRDKQSNKPKYTSEEKLDPDVILVTNIILRELSEEQKEWIRFKINYDKLPEGLSEPFHTEKTGYTWYRLTDLGKKVKYHLLKNKDG